MRHSRCWLRRLLVGGIARMGLALLAATAAGVVSVVAQTYPSRPITIIAPFPAGGPSDSLARALSEYLRASLGQPVIIENVSGASGSIGTGRVARAAPDGYTLGIGGHTPHVINPAVLSVTYDPLDDFVPIAPLVTSAHLIATRKTMPANDLKELIAWLKANPDNATNGTSGIASAIHMAGIFFQKETGTRFAFVPYRGSVPAMQDLVAGQIDIMIDVASTALPHARAGSIKAYAVTKSTRLEGGSDIPTVDEAGLPGFHVSTWLALFAPKGTPKEIVVRLNAAVIAALAEPAMRSRLASLGQEIFPRDQQTPEALATFHKAEIAKWWPMIKAAGIKVE
jgi:tripartite-type tricarboxylate transporter receptor subunit TctC